MNQFFVEPSAICDGKIIITGGDVKHIQGVLRLKIGEEISVVGRSDGLVYTCSIADCDKDSVTCIIQDVQAESSELPARITLYQGLPKSDKLEFVIQKAVEMGASGIVPVAMKRSVVKIDPKKAESKLKRWQSIAESAASQSKRGIVPEVSPVMSFKEAVAAAEKDDLILLPYELAKGMDETREILQAAGKARSISIFIGPEGGFEESEVKLAIEKGARVITLGRRILRTETAPIAILAWLTYLLDT